MNGQNILWISCEDLSPHFSFNGDNTIPTPHLDRFARDRVTYDHVFATAGVLAPSRCVNDLVAVDEKELIKKMWRGKNKSC
jgi:hypothetical protein